MSALNCLYFCLKSSEVVARRHCSWCSIGGNVAV